MVALGAAAAIAVAAAPPATPNITSSPPNPSVSTGASVSFTGEAGSTFECRLDTAAFATCTSPKVYAGLALGSHTFRVRALKGGKTSGEAAVTWSIAVPATPTITSMPANPTNATGATFAFTASAANATFECKLDAAAFAACTSPKAYAGPLGAAPHTFQVRALGQTGTSAPASFTWSIDTTLPPAPTIGAKPPVLSGSTGATFTFTDAEAGVSFLCRLDAAAFAACTSPRSYSGLAQGSHTFRVKARDAAGNESSETSWTWTVDTVPPPVPVITSAPPNPSSTAISTFQFTDAEPGVTFQCSIENGPFQACSSPTTFEVIVDSSNNGQHQFRVRAVDAAGNASSYADYKWKVDVVFTLTGNLPGLLQPGASLPLPLTVINPFNFPIVVSNIVVTVQPGSSQSGCDGPTELYVDQTSATVTVPGNGSVTLSGAQRPVVNMRNRAANQDACKGAVFSLTYTGSADK